MPIPTPTTHHPEDHDMDHRDVFEAWAPTGGVWSSWVKPVLFAHMADRPEGIEKATLAEVCPEPTPAPATTIAEGTAIVVDLPGTESIAAGLDLVRLGFRPVPLFNGCPSPMFLGRPYDEVVPTGRLIAGLIDGSDILARTALPHHAPPAFLLDADRLEGARRRLRPVFDNRWVVFATDFPSASLLTTRGIRNVLVVHYGRLNHDLVEVLRRWQRDGVTLTHDDIARSGEPKPLSLPSTWWTALAQAARRAWYAMSLQHGRDGGFGGFLLDVTAAGG
jgi:hypothetical protein